MQTTLSTHAPHGFNQGDIVAMAVERKNAFAKLWAFMIACIFCFTIPRPFWEFVKVQIRYVKVIKVISDKEVLVDTNQ